MPNHPSHHAAPDGRVDAGVQQDALRELLATRVGNFVRHMDVAAVRDALTKDDTQMLVSVLSAQVMANETSGAFAKARARGIERYRALLAEAGGTVSVQTLAANEGVKTDTIRRRINRGTLIAFHDAHGFHIPVIQLDEAGRRYAGLARVLAAMPEPAPAQRLRWLMQPHSELEDQTPIALIRAGRDHPMLLPLARAFGLQGGG